MIAEALQQIRAFAASVDGSLLDDATWHRRHRWISALAWLMTAFGLVFTTFDHHGGGEWVYPALMGGCIAAAGWARLGRRGRELAVTTAFACFQLYVARYVGNFTLGSVDIIILTFYQDWVPIAFGCCFVLVTILVAAIDPAVYASSAAFEAETPLTGLTLRGLAVLFAAGIALAVWRSGTQLARDQLTGLRSRAGAERILDREIARGRTPAAVVCDIDNFRSLNVQLGSHAGDRLLTHVAAQLRQLCTTLPGGGWLSGRLGADTFLIACHQSPGDAFIESLAHRIEAEAGIPAAGIAIHDVPVRLSVGAAVALPGESAASLIRAASQNMRDAKGRGTARVVVAQRADRNVAHQTSMLTLELYRACEHGELTLYLQPIVSLVDGMPIGAEALVRWHHPDRGLLWPGAFLPDAEQDSALMAVVSHTLGERFLEIALDLDRRHGPGWLAHGYCYNLAPVRLRDPTLMASMAAALANVGRTYAERRVELEVTEGALMDIEHGVPEVLAALRQLGFRLALDDFGTGHSSLAHLRDFPLDTVKIDKSFVQSSTRSPTDRAVVQAVADIASAAGLTVVAEGVETPAQRDLLLSVKPDVLAQGWLYAKALPVGEFEAWVRERKRAGGGLKAEMSRPA
jgi:diguanylate cyclase (GGDEF)-like protein